MYAWLFRHLPGPLWVRIAITVTVLAALIVALFGWVFPAVAPHLPVNDGLVGAPDPAGVPDPADAEPGGSAGAA